MINNRRTICILGGTGTVGVTACKVLSKLGYSLRVSVRNIETIKDTGMYMAPNIQLFELDIDKESNIGKVNKFFIFTIWLHTIQIHDGSIC